MRVALICPPHLLERYGNRTNYHLVLPNLFHLKKYRDFYQTRSEKGDFVILDNGAAEGQAFGAKHLFTLAEHVGADEIVVPDTLGDANDTLAQAQGFARYAKPDYRYMFVLQGSTVQEVMWCLRALDNGVHFMYVTTIGIPRHFYAIDPHFRMQLTEWLIEENFNLRFDIHFLGANQWLREVVVLSELAKNNEGFRGIDTSMPIYMGLEDMNMNMEHIPRPANYFHRADDNPAMVDLNIATYLNWAMYEKA